MSRFTIHAHVQGPFGLPLGQETQETDDPREALFLYLAASSHAEGAITVSAHVHDEVLDPGQPDRVSATGLLHAAACSPGGVDSYDEWVEKARAFRAEHYGQEWERVSWDKDTRLPVFGLDPETEKHEEEAREAVESVDDEFAQLVAQGQPKGE